MCQNMLRVKRSSAKCSGFASRISQNSNDAKNGVDDLVQELAASEVSSIGARASQLFF